MSDWPRELECIPPHYRFVDKDGRPVLSPINPSDTEEVRRAKEWLEKTWPKADVAPGEKPDPGPGFEVEILDTATGERRVSKQSGSWHDVGEFSWTENNFSCDCNRGREFDSAGGIEPGDYPCGKRFRVTHVTLPDGSRVEVEGEP